MEERIMEAMMCQVCWILSCVVKFEDGGSVCLVD